MNRFLFIALVIFNMNIAFASQIIATIAGEPITNKDFDNKIKSIEFFNNKKINNHDLAKIKHEVINSIINERIYLIIANKNNIDVSDSEVKAQLDNIRKSRSLSEAAFKKYINDNKYIKNQIYAEIAWLKFLNEKVKPKVKISEEELKDYMSNISNLKSVMMHVISIDPSDFEANKDSYIKDIENVKGCKEFDLFASAKKLNVDKINEQISNLNPALHDFAINSSIGIPSPIVNNGNVLNVFSICGRVFDKADPKMKQKYKEELLQSKVTKKGFLYLDEEKKKNHIEIISR